MVVEGLHVQIGAEPLPALQLLLGPGPAPRRRHSALPGDGPRHFKADEADLGSPHIETPQLLVRPFKSPTFTS